MTRTYKFEGHVIRLVEADYDEWARIYHAIPDLLAELYNLDLFYQSEVADKKDMSKWFIRTSSYLNRKHQEYTYKRQQWQSEVKGQWKTDNSQ